jgi:hypothetical protein
MKAIVPALRLTPLKVILVLLALAGQALLFSSRSVTFTLQTDAPARSQTTIGIGPLISFSQDGGRTSFQIDWAILAINLALTYLLACLLAGIITKLTHFRRPAVVYGITALSMAVIAFGISIAMSKSFWGYFFSRPKLIEEARDLVQVRAVVGIKTESIAGGQRMFVADEQYSFSNSIARTESDPYYCLEERILIDLKKRNLLPPLSATTFPELTGLYEKVTNSGLLAESDKGYDSSEKLGGIVVDGVDRSGSRQVILGLTGASVSNDHYPYYEMVFTGGKSASGLSFAHGQRFFYDVAGIEGMEWYSIWLLLTIPAVVIGFVVLTIGRLLTRLLTDRKKINPAALTAAGL